MMFAELWPKEDAWGGGGLFNNERTIGLNHLKSQMVSRRSSDCPKVYVSSHLESTPAVARTIQYCLNVCCGMVDAQGRVALDLGRFHGG
jgi:hypothetical protein